MPVFVNRARMTTATTGTGTITLGSAVSGYQSFAAAGVPNAGLVRYVIEDGANWEVGLGTYATAGTTLTRAPSESSSGGGAIALSGTAQVYVTAAAADLKGTVTNDNALAGYVGEYISATLASGSAVSLTNNTAANVVSISLTAGDWDVSALAAFTATGAFSVAAGISIVSATLPTAPNGGGYFQAGFATAAITSLYPAAGPMRLSLASTTTVYLVGLSGFSAGTCTVFGFLGARRVR